MKYPRAFSLKAGLKSSRRGAVEKNITSSSIAAQRKQIQLGTMRLRV